MKYILCSDGLHGHDAHSMGFLKIQNYRSASEFLIYTKNIFMWGCLFQTGVPRVPQSCPPAQTACGLPMFRDPDAYEIRDPHVFRGNCEKIISENTIGHVLRAAADSILSEHAAPSSGPASAGRGTRSVEKLFPGWPSAIFLNTGVIFCTIYCVFERAPQPHRTFYRTLCKIKE